MTTCIQRLPLFKDHLVVSKFFYHTSIKRPPLLEDHFFWPSGRLIQVSLYYEGRVNVSEELKQIRVNVSEEIK